MRRDSDFFYVLVGLDVHQGLSLKEELLPPWKFDFNGKRAKSDGDQEDGQLFDRKNDPAEANNLWRSRDPNHIR